MVSFIIVNWNGKEVIYSCIKSIYENCGSIPFEIILIDNASTDGSVELIKKNFPKVKVIYSQQNRYFAWSTNEGAKFCQGKYFFFVNNDIIITPNCVDVLVKVLNDDKDIGAVAPQLRYPEGGIQPSCRQFPTFLNLFISAIGIDRFWYKYSWKMRNFDHNHSRDVEQPMMSALLIRRECWEDVGNLDDDRFPLFFNDVDWCLRAWEKNWRIRFEPRAIAIHLLGWSGNRLGLKRLFLYSKGLYCYFRKHHVPSVFSWKWMVLLGLTGGTLIKNLLYEVKKYSRFILPYSEK